MVSAVSVGTSELLIMRLYTLNTVSVFVVKARHQAEGSQHCWKQQLLGDEYIQLLLAAVFEIALFSNSVAHRLFILVDVHS